MSRSRASLILTIFFSTIFFFILIAIIYYLNFPKIDNEDNNNNFTLDTQDLKLIKEIYIETTQYIFPDKNKYSIFDKYVINKSPNFHYDESELISQSNDVFQFIIEDKDSNNNKVIKNKNITLLEEKSSFTFYNPFRRAFFSGDNLIVSYDNWIEDEILIKDIYIDDQSINQTKGYINSFAPSPLVDDSGKYYYFAQNNSGYFLVSGSTEIPLPYDMIIDPPMYSKNKTGLEIRSGYEEVYFFAKRNEDWYFVMLNVKALLD